MDILLACSVQVLVASLLIHAGHAARCIKGFNGKTIMYKISIVDHYKYMIIIILIIW